MASSSLLAAERAAVRALEEIRAAILQEDQAAAVPMVPIDLIPIAEAARELRRSKQSVWRWIKRAGIGHRIGDRWHVSRDDLGSFLQRQ